LCGVATQHFKEVTVKINLISAVEDDELIGTNTTLVIESCNHPLAAFESAEVFGGGSDYFPFGPSLWSLASIRFWKQEGE
jgi:hypothetical protein